MANSRAMSTERQLVMSVAARAKESFRHRYERFSAWVGYHREVFQGRRDPMVPPAVMLFDGCRTAEEFIQSGQDVLRLCIDSGGLQPDSAILDVGSGNGRTAVALTKFLNPAGRYEGFDVVAEGIEWCTKKITPRCPNFRFRHVDVRNDSYNRRGTTTAALFRFPYDDDSFDLVVLMSVFTHMRPDDLE